MTDRTIKWRDYFFPHSFRELIPLWQSNRVLVAGKQETRQPWVSPPLLTHSQLPLLKLPSPPQTASSAGTSIWHTRGCGHCPYEQDADWLRGQELGRSALKCPPTAHCQWQPSRRKVWQFLRRLNIISNSTAMCTMYPTKELRPCPQESTLLDVYGTIIVQTNPRAETRVITGQRLAVHPQHGTLLDHTQNAVICYYMDKTFKNMLNENKPDTTMSYMTALIWNTNNR